MKIIHYSDFLINRNKKKMLYFQDIKIHALSTEIYYVFIYTEK